MQSKILDSHYRAIDAVSQSQITQALSMSPAAWLKQQSEPFSSTPKMRLGSLIHAMILEPDSLEATYVKAPKLDRRRTEHRLLAEALAADNRVQIDEEQLAQAEDIAFVIRKTTRFNDMFCGGEAEIAIHEHDIDGQKVKGKLDYLHADKDLIVDLKTTEIDLSDENLKWAMDQSYYKIQAAFYLDLMHKERPGNWSFCFAFVNVKAPFEMRKVIISDLLNSDWIDEGRQLYLTGLSRIVKWKAENHYPRLIDMPAFIPQSKPWKKNV
jgi:hypothetical protein